MDRASTIRFYDHYGHVSAAVCYQNTLHARTGDGRLDHARTHEPRGRKGVKLPAVKLDESHYLCVSSRVVICTNLNALSSGSQLEDITHFKQDVHTGVLP